MARKQSARRRRVTIPISDDLYAAAGFIRSGEVHPERDGRERLADRLIELAQQLKPKPRGRRPSAEIAKLAGIADALMLVFGVDPKVAVRAAIGSNEGAYSAVYKLLFRARKGRQSNRHILAISDVGAYAQAVDRLPKSAPRGQKQR